MNSKFNGALAAATALCLVATSASAQTATPEIYGALPNVSDVAISPDGTKLATLQSVGETVAVIFYDLADTSAKPEGVNLGDNKGRALEWADDSHLFLLVSQASKVPTSDGLKTIEFWRWTSIARPNNKANVYFTNEPGYYNPDPGDLVAIAPERGKAYFTRWTPRASASGGNRGPSRLKKDSGWGYSVFEANLEGGGVKQIANGEEETVDWVVDRSGQPVLRLDYKPEQNVREVRVRDDGQFKLIKSFPEKDGEGATISFHGLSPTPGKALASTYSGGDKRQLVEFDLTTGAIGPAVFSNSDYDLDSVEYFSRGAAVSGATYIDDIPRTVQLDPADQKQQVALAKALPGAAPMIISKYANGDRLIVKAIYTDHPDQYFLYDKTAKTLKMVAASYQKLDGRVAAAKERYDYRTDDGLNIRGYLTVPAGASKSNMPLIVLPHGGPEARDDMTFDWWSFFYAARGYLVYQPNFRGSEGYGYSFRTAGYGEWGRKMQDDITGGVKKLIADGMVDPNRICIAGGSYGGYAALAGATLTPDLYKCAVSVNGVSNLAGMIGQRADWSEEAEDYWSVRIGNRFRDAKALDAVSPSKQAANAKAAILLIHGKDDTVVPVGQSRQMRDALKSAGKPLEYIELPGEDHWLSRAGARTEMLRASISFIDKHIGAAKP